MDSKPSAKSSSDLIALVLLLAHQLSGLSNRALCVLLEKLDAHQFESAHMLRIFQQQHTLADVARTNLCWLCEGRNSAVIDQAWQQLRWIQKNNIALVSWVDPSYPTLLKEITQPPALLYVKGNKALLSELQLALVGARKATPHGCNVAYQLSTQLSQAGLLVASGLALGIDAASHRAALDAGYPTLAILGTGIDRTYPRQHLQLAQQIATSGALVSEFPLGAPPRRHHFPQRNRLLSGLSLGVLVIEASIKSGSLITAKFALEQGREVFAVPGSISNMMAQGCHQLIKDGASLVQSTSDIVEHLQDLGITQLQRYQLNTQAQTGKCCDLSVVEDRGLSLQSATVKAVYELIQDQGSSLDELQQCSRLSVEELHAGLLELQCQGRVACQMGAYFKV